MQSEFWSKQIFWKQLLIMKEGFIAGITGAHRLWTDHHTSSSCLLKSLSLNSASYEGIVKGLIYSGGTKFSNSNNAVLAQKCSDVIRMLRRYQTTTAAAIDHYQNKADDLFTAWLNLDRYSGTTSIIHSRSRNIM
jgi:hypothetical protein